MGIPHQPHARDSDESSTYDDAMEDSSCRETLSHKTRLSRSRKQSFNFLALPLEIRDEIYSLLLCALSNKHTDEDGYTTYPLTTSLFRVNKQVRLEARRIFRLHNVFIAASTPWAGAAEHLQRKGRIPFIAEGEPAQRLAQDVHMTLRLEMPEPSHHEGAARFVLLAEDLDWFCRFWRYNDLSYPGLNSVIRIFVDAGDRLKSREAVPRELERKLLMPFAYIKNPADMVVNGFSAEAVAEMEAEQAIPNPSAQECLDECNTHRDAGLAHVARKEFDTALSCYTKAFHAIHILIDGRQRDIWGDAFFDTILTSGPHRSQNASILRIELRIKLVANVVYAYLQLKDYPEARFWGERSISLMRTTLGPAADEPRMQFPASREWGFIYYWVGIACREMRDMDEARNMFRIAKAWLPNEREVQEMARATTLRLPAPR